MRAGLKRSFRRLSDRIGGQSMKVWSAPLGVSIFTAPVDGEYKFFLLGAGASGRAAGSGTVYGGAGGAYAEKTLLLSTGTQVALVVGTGGDTVSATSNGVSGGATSAELPGGSVVAGGGQRATSSVKGVGGVATGGDYMANGGASAEAGVNGGAANTGTSTGGTPGGRQGAQPFPVGNSLAFDLAVLPGMGGTGSTTKSQPGGHGALTIIWQE